MFQLNAEQEKKKKKLKRTAHFKAKVKDFSDAQIMSNPSCFADTHTFKVFDNFTLFDNTVKEGKMCN